MISFKNLLGKVDVKKRRDFGALIKNDEVLMKDDNSPYIKGRQAWDEIYGSSVTENKNKNRIIAFLSIALIVSALVNWHIASQSKLIPVVVQIDPNGNVISSTVMASSASSPLPSNAIQGAAINFIKSARTITGSPDLDQESIKTAQSMTEGDANNTLNSYYTSNNPLLLGKSEKVIVQIAYIIPKGTSSYEISWQETTQDSNNQTIAQANYTAELTYELGPIKDIRYNPLGFYITNLTWAKQF